MNKSNRGISLIILVITIVVIIILATAVIVSFITNNPINSANEAKFKSDISAFKSELDLYKASNFVDTLGKYKQLTLHADKINFEYNGKIETGKTILETIPSMTNTRYYENAILRVFEGKIVYVGNNDNEKDWSEDVGLDVVDAKLEIVTVLSETTINSATFDVKLKETMPNDIKYEIYLSEDNGLNYTKKEVKRTDTTNGSNGASILIENLKNETTYKVKAVAADEKGRNSEKIVEITTGIIEVPKITQSSTTWTNENIEVIITYKTTELINEYSIDGGTIWLTASMTQVLSISKNQEVYAKVKDSVGNEVVSTIVIGNIDKTLPNAFTISLTSQTPTSFTISGNTTDDLSGIKVYEYYVDNVLKHTGIEVTYNVTRLDPAQAHTVRVKAYDKATNVRESNTITVPIAQFTITGISANETMGTVIGGGIYTAESTAILTAVPKIGYKFVKWTDGVSVPTRQIIVNANSSYTATFAREVLTSIKITTSPSKISYSSGQKFNTSGMIVKATYDSLREVEITSYTYPNVQLTQWQTSVTLTYTENGVTKTIIQEITVGPQMAVYEKYNAVQGGYTTKDTGRSKNVYYSGSKACTHTSICSFEEPAADLTVYDSYSIDSNGQITLTGGSRSGYSLFNSIKTYEYASGYAKYDNYLVTNIYKTQGIFGCETASGIYREHRREIMHGKMYEIIKGADIKGKYISDVTLVTNSVPSNGIHTDGYWYVFKNLIVE